MTRNYSISVTPLLKGISEDYNFNQATPIFAHESYKIKVELSDKRYKNDYKNNIRWDFGDGTVVVGQTATHYYKHPGKYQIKCTLYLLNGTPVEPEISTSVIVKEAIPTELKFLGLNNFDPQGNRLERTTWLDDITCCKNNNLGKIQVSVSNVIGTKPEISAIRRWKNSNNKEFSYFDISSKSYYHLDKYYTFLEKQEVHSIGSIDSNFIQSFLRPVTSYKPEYIDVYGFYSYNGNVILNAYAVADADTLDSFEFTPVSPEISYTSSLQNDREKVEIRSVNSLKNLPSEASFIGRIAIIDVWYKNDNISPASTPNDLIFEFNKDTFKFKDEPSSADYYLNIPPLGVSVNVKPFDSSKDTLCQALTSNGLFNSEYIAKNNDEQFIISDSSPFSIETHLIYNLYLNYEIEIYNSNFILNDPLETGSMTYSLYKQAQPTKYQLKQNNDDNYRLLISPVNEDYADYIQTYRLMPKSKNGFTLQYIDGNESPTFLTCNKIVSLEELVLPAEKRPNIDGKKVFETYMQHPMYDDTPNLKTLLNDVFNRNNMLSYVTAKGINILDDNVNYKTCYLNKFLSILEMMDEPVTHFDMSSFDKINDLKELVRILTMNYSDLFGNILSNEFDIRITYTFKGFNVGDQLEPSDIILCEIVKDSPEDIGRAGDIVAIRRGNKILPLITKTPYLILKDDFTFETSLVNFVGIDPPGIETFDDQTESWKASHEWTELYAYTLDDYNKSWGWVMNLPEEVDYKHNRAKFIDAYYTLYLFNPKNPQIRKYNFLSEDTIPKVNDEQISVEDWNDDYGFAYDCLMKILTYNLNLRDSN